MLVFSNFNVLIAFALVLNLAIFVVPLALLFRRRQEARLEAPNWLGMIIGLSVGAVLIFVVALYYFWLGFLAMVVLVAANTGYGLIETRSTRNQTSVEFRRLFRNILVMITVMAPLLFFAVLVIKGVSAIIGWVIAYSAFSSVIIAKYIKDRRQSRTAPN